jgi:uncharacterized tellurite resistance protein B-like protein
MSEELLKAIIQLFAIVAKERITDDERTNIKEFLSLHLNQEAIRYYLNLFDEFVKTNRKVAAGDLSNVDEETLQFVDDWSRIMQISKKVNQALTMPQKAVLVTKIIELVFADGQISERQGNLIFYIGEALKIPAMMPFLSATPGRTDWPGATVGEHNDEVLGDLLGYGAEERQALARDGVI